MLYQQKREVSVPEIENSDSTEGRCRHDPFKLPTGDLT